jgi:Icc-related predicted phosphoesterase
MKIVVFGDVHNRYDNFANYVNEVSNQNIDFGIQVGDMGFHPKHTDMDDLAKLRSAASNVEFPIHWLDGNHEDHSILQYLEDFNNSPQNIFGDDLTYQSRGSYIEMDTHILFFIGGARSIDKNQRIIDGLDWFPEEEILRGQEDAVFDAIEHINNSGKEVIMLTHTCPFFDDMSLIFGKSTKAPSWQQKFLREVLERLTINPKMWFHGHFHKPIEYKIDGFDTEFISLGALFRNDASTPFYKIVEI